MLRRSCVFLVAGVFVLPAAAQRYDLGTLTITHPWARPTAPGMPMGVAYLTITNNGKVPDALVAASTPVATRVEFHQTSIADGMARMRPLREIVVAPGQTVRVEPGGIHLMLVDLESALVTGKPVPLTLEFRVAGRTTVELSIAAQFAPVTEAPKPEK
jgi:periplasmic copper chaperone A